MFHDFRHTFASHYMMNGGNLFDLQKFLGHADIKMTQRYAHLCPDYLHDKIQIINFS
ncbi:MAG: tyrosine-type recombinase/integrase [Bdellovibrionaceae bacterium]|nr:tyrosine-type recombinase/integrase [Pseudobdellovibrionaceae bacterium]